jgi:hypothetical protein
MSETKQTPVHDLASQLSKKIEIDITSKEGGVSRGLANIDTPTTTPAVDERQPVTGLIPSGQATPSQNVPMTASASESVSQTQVSPAPNAPPPLWRRLRPWLLILQVLATIGATSVPILSFFIIDLRKDKSTLTKELARLEANAVPIAGWYRNPGTNGLMTNIVNQTERQAVAAPSDMYILSDVATFGSITHPEMYQKYLSALESAIKRARSANKKAKAVFHSSAVAIDFFGRQFPESQWSTTISDPSFCEKVRAWLSREDVAKAVVMRGVLSAAEAAAYAKSVAGITREVFFKCVEAHNEDVISQLKKAGLRVKRSNAPLSIHLWQFKDISDGDCPDGIIGIVDFTHNVDELGFFLRGELGAATEKLADDMFDSLRND